MESPLPDPVRTREMALPRRRGVVAVCIGNAIEWFDWSLYAVLAPVFATTFFSPDDPYSALLSTFGVFMVGFLARPVGGFLFGVLADRRGRRVSLAATMLLTGLGSCVIALAPTYEQVGLGASIALVAGRVVQGLGFGGEAPASYAYIAELAPRARRGLWSSGTGVGIAAGSLAATLLGLLFSLALTPDQVATWGWRAAFLLAGGIGLYAVYLRRRLAESAQFLAAHADGGEDRPVAVLQVLRAHRTRVLQVLGIATGAVAVFYYWIAFVPAYTVSAMHHPAAQVQLGGVVAQLTLIAALPIAGMLSDRLGRKRMAYVMGSGFILLAFPLDALVRQGGWQFVLAVVVAALLISCTLGPFGAMLVEQFPAAVRGTAIAVPYTIATTVAGAVPYVGTWLTGVGAHDVLVVIVTGLVALTLAAYAALPETARSELQV